MRLPGYVEGGGAYLGLCAGAYYACRRIEFEVGTRHAITAAHHPLVTVYCDPAALRCPSASMCSW